MSFSPPIQRGPWRAHDCGIVLMGMTTMFPVEQVDDQYMRLSETSIPRSVISPDVGVSYPGPGWREFAL